MPILTPDDGLVARTPEEAQALQVRGYQQCYGSRRFRKRNIDCDFHIAPETQTYVGDKGGYYTCPRCLQSHDLMHDLPWHGIPEEEGSFSAGGGTRIGLKLNEQGDTGEELIKNMGELPGYGKITWIHPGSSASNSPLDMATHDWGIEIKTLGYDAIHHRFIPGRPKEKADKNAMALAQGLKGILGVLVLLNYRSGLADIYVREYPVDPATGTGIGSFRSLNAQHLVAEVPFNNVLMDPSHPAPQSPTPPPLEDEAVF